MSLNNLKAKCEFPGCDKLFSSRYNLKRHFETTHQNIKRFICEVCDKPLSSKQNLKEHMHIHSKIKPFVCEEHNCGQCFRQRSQLSSHKKLHLEVYTYVKCREEIKELKVLTTQLTSLLNDNSDDFFSNQNTSISTNEKSSNCSRFEYQMFNQIYQFYEYFY